MATPAATVLDNPVWWALQGRQRTLGTITSRAARFAPEVSPFGAFASSPTHEGWADLEELTGRGGSVALIGVGKDGVVPPERWTLRWTSPGVQMVASSSALPGRSGPGRPGRSEDSVVTLGPADVADMLALVTRSRPGPFGSRTVEFGGYVGVRRRGRLVAMAGERLCPAGYAEISAVTTDPDCRRQGLAELVLSTVAEAIGGRGEIPFLHVAAGNDDAIRLYRDLGFVVRRPMVFTLVEAPDRAR